MKIVTLSSKRQITIPKHILGDRILLPGDRLIIQKEQYGLSIKPLGTSVVRETAGSLGQYISSAKRGVSLAEILRETKKKTSKKLAGEA